MCKDDKPFGPLPLACQISCPLRPGSTGLLSLMGYSKNMLMLKLGHRQVQNELQWNTLDVWKTPQICLIIACK